MSTDKGFPMPSAAEFQAMTPDEFEMFWKTFVAMGADKFARPDGVLYVSDRDVRDCCTMKHAGWLPEPDSKDSQLFAWRWRRPPIGNRPKGKLFLSTGQAMSELRRTERTACLDKGVRFFDVDIPMDGQIWKTRLPAKGFLEAQLAADNLNAALKTDGLIVVHREAPIRIG